MFFKMSMKRIVQLLKSYFVKKFPELNDGVGFYLSQRSKFVHVGLDLPLYSIKNYPDLIEEIYKFLAMESGFELVYPRLVLTVKCKFDYIIAKKF